jgi:hypothetical protein
MKTTKQNKNPQIKNAPTIKTPATLPTPEEIRRRAHQIYLDRGAVSGRESDDWLLAGYELKKESSRE